MRPSRILPAVGLLVTAILAVLPAPEARAAIAPTSVSDDVRVTPRAAGQNVEDFKSPSVAIDPSNPNRIVIASRHDQPDFGCRIDYSTDGGATWSPASYPPPPKETCWSPTAAWDSRGNAYVAAQNRPPGGGFQNIIVWRSNDGQSFEAPVVIPNSSGFQAGIAVDTHPNSPFQGRIYVTWYRFPNFPASIDTTMAFSDDGGQTWSEPISRPVAGQYQEFPQPAVAPDGTVYVVFKDGYSNFFTNDPPVEDPPGCLGLGGSGDPSNGATCPIRVLRSSNGGASFDADPFTVATATYNDLSVGEQPGIAITPNGTLLVTFSSIRHGCASNQDALVARSTDRAQSWSQPVGINDDPCAGGATQRLPWVSVAPNGRVDALFYDNRVDDSDPRTVYDIRYANSTDGGQTFGPNIRLSDTAFDTTTFFEPRSGGFQSNLFDQRTGIDSTNARAIGAWGDPRQAPSPTSTRSDVFSARVDFTPPPPPPDPPPPPPPPTPPPGVNTCGVPDAAGYLQPAKLRVSRARVLRQDRRLDVLAPITSRAGGDVAVTFQADNRKDTFDEDVSEANTALDVIRISKRITRGQARLGTGIVNINYLGDEDTRPQLVRLRAASQRAELDVEEISLIDDRLSATGSVTDRAQGVVRFRFSYVDPDGTPNVHEARAKIKNNGDWKLNKHQVPAQLARCGGYLSIQFTGYFPRRIRGEQLAYQLNAGQTRRP